MLLNNYDNKGKKFERDENIIYKKDQSNGGNFFIIFFFL